jgi:2-methylcitrate dehydratase PrpD
MSATSLVAEFAAGVDVPGDALAVAARSRVDTACAALVGESAAERVHVGAAWATAVRAASSQYDDTAVWGSAGAVLWPALTAVAGDDVDDDRLADAFCVGVAVGGALWRVGRYREADRGFDGTSVFGPLAAAAACARYVELPVDGVVAALAVAASGSGGLLANLGTDLAPVHAGMAATAGVRAARLARAGFQGAPDVLEGRIGFGEAFFGPDRLPDDAVAHALSTPDYDVRLREYPCHAESQALVAALVAAPGDVTAVEVGGIGPESEAVRFDVPETSAQAGAALRYVLALALVHGTVTRQALDPKSSPGAAGLLALDRIRVGISPRWDERPVPRIAVTVRDGDTAELPLARPGSTLASKWRRVAAELTDAGHAGTARRVSELVGG